MNRRSTLLVGISCLLAGLTFGSAATYLSIRSSIRQPVAADQNRPNPEENRNAKDTKRKPSTFYSAAVKQIAQLHDDFVKQKEHFKTGGHLGNTGQNWLFRDRMWHWNWSHKYALSRLKNDGVPAITIPLRNLENELKALAKKHGAIIDRHRRYAHAGTHHPTVGKWKLVEQNPWGFEFQYLADKNHGRIVVRIVKLGDLTFKLGGDLWERYTVDALVEEWAP